mmetsp:Transcript_33715/g.107745  ORF Transcript_33715/g.107745 Transcript_33715/m.107745 type:complete len:231 (+) Transcript_33715:307-999(+)
MRQPASKLRGGISFFIFSSPSLPSFLFPIHPSFLGVIEGGDAGEFLAFKEFEGGAAAGGDVGHLVGEAGLFDGGDGVAPADDGDGALGGDVDEGVADVERTLREGVHFEDAHGPVPDDRLALGELFLDHVRSLGPVVEAHPSLGDFVRADDHGIRVGGEGVGDDDFVREDEFDALFFREGHGLLGGVEVVVFDERGADFFSLSFKEGEGHAAADDDLIALADEGLEDGDF